MTKNWIQILLIFSILYVPEYPFARAQQTSYKDHQIKAAYLLKITDYMNWPQVSFDQSDKDFVIGLYGDNIIKKSLLAANEKFIQGRKLVIKQIQSIDEGKRCQILVIGNDEIKKFSEIKKKLEFTSVLTVGDSKGFASKGGILNFLTIGKNVRFEINYNEAKKKKITIDSKLLRLAKIVKTAS